MNYILMGFFTFQLIYASVIPVANTYEIEKQKLVKFPEETIPYEKNEQKSVEAKRILEEINKINVALGYVKKQETNVPTFLDSNQYLFPQPTYHPYHSQTNYGALQASIRNLRPISSPYSSQRSQYQKINEPKKMFYYYVPKSLVVPKSNGSLSKKLRIIVDNNRHKYLNADDLQEFKLRLNNGKSPIQQIRLYFIPREARLSLNSGDQKIEKKSRIEKLTTPRPFLKETTEKQRLNTKASLTSTTLPPPLSSLKTPFASFFKRPANTITAQKIETKPILQSVPLTSPQAVQQSNIQSSNDDYGWGMESSEETDYPSEFEKYIFSAKRKETAEIQKEALKESGVIIQRLKVRKGGIAIAGPGGVATAGSGGTAIVGPGGYALTHPRSLTIAGPGAKVIAVPSSTDLKDALLRSNSERSYFNEGKLVATGPVIYFAPDNNGEV